MIDADQALSGYLAVVERSTLEDFPIVWACHYNRDTLLGCMGTHRMPEDKEVGHVVYPLMIPFAFTHSIQYSYVVVDESAVTGRWVRRRLIVSRMLKLGDGVLVSHWAARLSIGDRQTHVGKATLEPNRLPRVDQALSVIMDNRLALDPGFTFDDAWAGAAEMLDEILT